jgi:TolB-like protein/tRNA A-37 threonylcarbamoyl transferase component Bud32
VRVGISLALLSRTSFDPPASFTHRRVSDASDREALTGLFGERFSVQREIGRGGMATVYLAQDHKHDRLVAIKVLRPELAATVSAERFLREIHTIARLQHPHILPLHDSGEFNDLLYYVMPYVQGESLRARMARGPRMELDEALRITREVADALAEAHANQVVHRDIKPENILLSGGHALVADFGIARALSAAEDETLTMAGLVVGTPAYMAPEQITAERSIDGRADIYALACILYEMLAGVAPFASGSVQETMAKHTLAPVPRLRELRPDVPESVERALMRAMAKLPGDRFPDARAFAQALAETGLTTASRRPRWRTAAFAAAAVIVVIAGYNLVRALGSPGEEAAQEQAPSIAVLALRTVGGNPDDDALAEGISEEIASTIGRLPGMSVKAPRSAFSFKGKNLPVREIGAALGVRYLVDGSFQRVENQMRVRVQLVSAANDSVIWSNEYDRPFGGVFAMQDEIARGIANELRVYLGAAGQGALARRSTVNPEAHALYLRGRYLFERRDSLSLRRAREYFEQAIAKDSGFALAYAGLSDSYSHAATFGYERARESMPIARTLAERALALDSSLVEAHSSLAFISLFYDFDFATAGREFATALRLNPNYHSAHLWKAWYYLAVDSGEAAVEEARTAVNLEPFMIVPNVRLVTFLYLTRNYPEALQQSQRTFEIDSMFFQARSERSRVLLKLGRCGEALADVPLSGEQGASQLVGTRGQVYAGCGRRQQALEELQRLEAQARAGRIVSHYGLAVLHAALGNDDRALAELEAAYEDRAWAMFIIKWDPAFDNLRTDPRFVRIAQQVGLSP